MNEGRQITKEQAEACMRADSRFLIVTEPTDEWIYRMKKETIQYEHDGKWFASNAAAVEDLLIEFGYIHADPNNTFERLFGSGELTFEEARVKALEARS